MSSPHLPTMPRSCERCIGRKRHAKSRPRFESFVQHPLATIRRAWRWTGETCGSDLHGMGDTCPVRPTFVLRATARRAEHGEIMAILGCKGITEPAYSPDVQKASPLAPPNLRHLFRRDLADAGNEFERPLATF